MSSLQMQTNIVYKRRDLDINKVISFRPVTLQEDLERIHNWMNQPHVIPFWKLGFSLNRIKAHLKKALADQHQTLYIGLLDGVPMSYWESYWAIDDIIGNYYPANVADHGIHLLIGEPTFLGKGYALPLLRSMTDFQFENKAVQKIVTEPDIRNKKMIHIFEKCGFEFQKPVELPDKTGSLMFCLRDRFKNRFPELVN